MPALEKTSYSLYQGSVKLVFDPNATGRQPRYTVTDSKLGKKDSPVRGVTTILRDILHKPDLMRWPLNMSNTAVFGAKFDEVLKEYVHDWDKALIKPGEVTADQLHEAMMEGSRASTRKSEKGADIGTLAHSVVEGIVKGEKDPLTRVIEGIEFDAEDTEEEKETKLKDAQKALAKIDAKFRMWWGSLQNPEVIWSEKPIYSRRLNYAGTLDLTIATRGATYILDFKTTNRSRSAPLGIYPDYFLQLGGYSYALNEEEGIRIGDLGIVNVTKDGQLGVMTAGDMKIQTEECERAFAFAVRLHDWLEQTKKTLQANVKTVSHLNPLAEVDEQAAQLNTEAINV